MAFFNDSLPGGWGLLLMDRALRGHGLQAHETTPLDRLAYIGSRAMGALEYEPTIECGDSAEELNIAQLAQITAGFDWQLHILYQHRTLNVAR